MGASFHTMVFSALSSLFLVVLFSIERHRGVRFGEQFRGIFDRMFVQIGERIHAVLPPINDHFFQELFYFCVHKALSFILGTIRRLERLVLKIVRFNRMQVVRLRTRATVERGMTATPLAENATTEHLAQIAAHKKENELSPREKQKRKERSISGDGPF